MLSHSTRGLLYLFPSYYSINMLATLVVVIFLSIRLREYSHDVNRVRPPIKSEEEEEEEEVDRNHFNDFNQQNVMA